MPIYEYRCKSCGRVFEHLQIRAGDEPEKCPSCGASGFEQVMSVTAPPQMNEGASSASSCPTGTCSLGSTCSTGKCPF